MAQTLYSDFLKSIDIASKALLMYSEKHPHTQQVIELLLSQLHQVLKDGSQVIIAVSDGKLLVNGQLIEATTPVLERLYRDLHSRNIHSLSFQKDVTPEELLALFRTLNLKPQRIKQMGGFEQILSAEGLRHIEANKLKYGLITDQDVDSRQLLSDLTLALQAAMAGETDVQVTAQNVEQSANASAVDAPALIHDVLKAIARSVPEGEEGRLDLEKRARIAEVVRSFSPEMLGQLLLRTASKSSTDLGVLFEIYSGMSNDKMEAALLSLIDRNADRTEVQELIHALEHEEQVEWSDEVKRRLQLIGLLHTTEVTNPDRWNALLTQTTLTSEDLQQIPEALSDLLKSERLEDADRLSKKVFGLLSSKEPSDRIAAVHLLPEVVRLLSHAINWKNLEATALLLVSTCYRKENDTEVLRVLLEYLLSGFREHYVRESFGVCNDLLATIRQRAEKDDTLRASLLGQLPLPNMDEQLRGASVGVEVILEYLRLCGPEGAQHILRLLGDEQDRNIRSRLIQHMLRLNLDAVLAALEAGMLDPRWYVVRNVITVAGKLPLQQLPAFVDAAATNHDHRIVQELIKTLHRATTHPRLETVQALLQHPDKSVRLQTIHLAGARNMFDAIGALLPIAIEGGMAETDFRAAALEALLKLRSHEAIPVAVQILNRKPQGKLDVAERNAAVKLLGELNRAASRDTLIQISRTDPNQETRALATSYIQ